MTIQQVQRLLEEQHELKVSYMSVYRYVRSHIVPLCKPVTVRMHSPAGEQGQVDFGYAGLMQDPETGKRRKTDQRAYLNRMLRLETEPALANATFCALPA